MEAGAVAALGSVRGAIVAAKLVMVHTSHTLLAGTAADAFAKEMGLPTKNLSTPASLEAAAAWRSGNCQPNYRRNVVPDHHASCGPYRARDPRDDCTATARLASWNSTSCYAAASQGHVSLQNHDTIAMMTIDNAGSIAAGASSNGASHKVPGRVGDAAVPGGASYADSDVGACGSTGDGDLHLRFLPCYQVVESMRRGLGPKVAAEDAVQRIVQKFPTYVGAVVAVDRDGNHGGACHGWNFTYAVHDTVIPHVQLFEVESLVARSSPIMPLSKCGHDAM